MLGPIIALLLVVIAGFGLAGTAGGGLAGTLAGSGVGAPCRFLLRSNIGMFTSLTPGEQSYQVNL